MDSSTIILTPPILANLTLRLLLNGNDEVMSLKHRTLTIRCNFIYYLLIIS